jgi:transposase
MARKHYTDEFRRQAVDLYESTPGATLRGIAEDLGIVRGTLTEWVRALGTGTTTASTGSPSTPPGPPQSGQRPESQTARIGRLEARVKELEASETKLSTEREILRSAAKYFAGETNW